jgi:nuclear factor 6 (one cut domain family protein 1)
LNATTGRIACKRKEDQQSVAKSPTAPKKPRLVFTDLQRRTLQAIFKETKRPSKEMQITISQQLGLELSTVGNFFMNARRRSQDKWLDDVLDTGSMSPASTSSSSRQAMSSTSNKTIVTAQPTSVLTIGNAAIVTCT